MRSTRSQHVRRKNSVPDYKDVAYKKEGLPARLQGQNLRVRGRHYARASRDQVTQWDQHPWSIAQYLIAKLPICELDDDAPKDCDYCADMESPERAKRVSTAKNKRKKYNQGAKNFNNRPSTCTSVVVDEASARTYAEDNNLIYEADRSTFTKLPRDAAGGPEAKFAC